MSEWIIKYSLLKNIIAHAHKFALATEKILQVEKYFKYFISHTSKFVLSFSPGIENGM